eukprot:2969805-Rhodomonas_salina.1
MSGTDLAYGAIVLRTCYGISGTDLPGRYAATRRRSWRVIECSSISVPAYNGMRCPVLTYRMVRPGRWKLRERGRGRAERGRREGGKERRG